MLAYARKKGLYVGVALGGALITVAENASGVYYGRSATPREIIEGGVGNPRSLELRHAASQLIK
jgi:lipid-binding SYLF domain-containing protein